MAHCPCCKKTSVRQRQNVVSGVGGFQLVVHDLTCLECGTFENSEADDAAIAAMYRRWGADAEATRRAALAKMRELAMLVLALERDASLAA